MRTSLSATSGRTVHPPSEVAEPRSIRRVGPIDRLALHLGVALITWGRRPRVADDRDTRARRSAQYNALVARERAAERELRLTIPIR